MDASPRLRLVTTQREENEMPQKARKRARERSPVPKRRQGIPLTEHTYSVLQELKKLEDVDAIEDLMVILIKHHPKGGEVDKLVTRLEQLREGL